MNTNMPGALVHRRTTVLVLCVILFFIVPFFSAQIKSEAKNQKVEKKFKVSIEDIPPLEYDESTSLFANQFVNHINNQEYETIYKMFSANLSKEMNYKQAEEVFKWVTKSFGIIQRLEELKKPTSDMSPEDPNNPLPYFALRLDSWKMFLKLNFKVRIFRAVCDKGEPYLMLAISEKEKAYTIEAFEFNVISLESTSDLPH